MKQNYFELFQLPVSFQIDPADLAARHRAVIARVHPDPMAAWRRGDDAVVRDLAALELRSAGIKLRA